MTLVHTKHMVAVVDGVVRDTYDPSRDGTRCVYGYFQPPESYMTVDVPTLANPRISAKRIQHMKDIAIAFAIANIDGSYT